MQYFNSFSSQWGLFLWNPTNTFSKIWQDFVILWCLFTAANHLWNTSHDLMSLFIVSNHGINLANRSHIRLKFMLQTKRDAHMTNNLKHLQYISHHKNRDSIMISGLDRISRTSKEQNHNIVCPASL